MISRLFGALLLAVVVLGAVAVAPVHAGKRARGRDCVTCTQNVPDCKPGYRLVKQTCRRCAHCAPKRSVETQSTQSLR
jgi:hypothetical protein